MTNNKNTLNKKYFGENLWRLRDERNITHEELAEQIQKSPRYIYKLENGESTPSLDTLISICNVLGVSMDSILRSA